MKERVGTIPIESVVWFVISYLHDAGVALLTKGFQAVQNFFLILKKINSYL